GAVQVGEEAVLRRAGVVAGVPVLGVGAGRTQLGRPGLVTALSVDIVVTSLRVGVAGLSLRQRQLRLQRGNLGVADFHLSERLDLLVQLSGLLGHLLNGAKLLRSQIPVLLRGAILQPLNGGTQVLVLVPQRLEVQVHVNLSWSLSANRSD